MHILYLNSINCSNWGGGEKWMLTGAEGLRQRGHQIYFCGQPRSVLLDRAGENNFMTYAIPMHGDFNPWTIFKIGSLIRRHKIDIIIANFNKDVRLAGIAKRFARRGRVIARNGLPIISDKFVYRLTYRFFADKILTNTASIRNKYLQYGWMDDCFIRMIHNGIDIPNLPEQKDLQLLSRYSIPANAKIIGFFGRFVGQKQPLTFLEVAHRIASQVEDSHFLMLGDGPLLSDLQKEARSRNLLNRLILPGFKKDIRPYLLLCDLVLLTSYKEGLPNIILEAMSAQKAVVAFDVGGVRELLPESSLGCVVPFNDIHSMAEHSIFLLNHPDERNALGMAANRYVQENFSTEKMISELETFLLSLLQD